jgi:molybdate-binding protein/DNA-binding XRE family transcriptional regulator
MADGLSNRVRELREARGLSQSALASSVSLSRQSVLAIEAGRAIPAVDVALRIARALDCPVEALFVAAASSARLLTEPVGDVLPGRVALSHISGRWLSYSLGRSGIARSADAIVHALARGHAEVEVLRSEAEARGNVVLMGCAPALGLLADRLNARPGLGRFLWFPRSSTRALEALGQKHAHLSGVHLVDAKTGESNVPDVRIHSRKRGLVLITLARWEVGLVVAANNPKHIARVQDLEQRDVRLVSREPGSGALRLLARELTLAGLPIELAERSALCADGHLEVAEAVAMGAADVGIATRDAALAFGLAFLPLAEERYDVAVPRDELSDPRLVRLLEVMTAAPFRRELAALGYDVAPCGERVAEIGLA